MVYAINISCYYFAFPECTSHHGLHPGLNASPPRVTLSGILRSAIIHICATHSDNSVFLKSASTRCLTLNIDQTSESTNFSTEANRRRSWDAQCQGRVHGCSSKWLPLPFPSPAAVPSPPHYPKATPPTPESVNNPEVPSLFNGCLAPGVLSRFLGCNEQTAGTEHRWFSLGLIMI